MLLSFFQFFTKKLRLSKPWKYKAPLILTFTYFFILTGNVSHQEFINTFLAAIMTVIGFSGIGYLTNDLSDRKKDEKTGKQNSITGLSTLQIFFIGIFLTAVALLPWLYLPVDRISIFLIGSELLLFIIYAFPPFRLKEKGFLGLIVDALYAHVVPSLLASWTFYLVANASYELFIPFIIALGTWQLMSGIRNILSHQIVDFENDKKSGTHTWVTKKGVVKAEKLMKNVLIPLEIITFLGFLFFIQKEINYFIFILIGFLILAYRSYAKVDETEKSVLRKQFTNIFLDDFYIKWLPIIVLSGIMFIETEVRTVLILHLLLFQQQLQKVVFDFIHKIKNRFINSWLITRLFNIQNYYKGFAIHIGVMLFYVSLYVIVYYIMEANIEDVETFMWQQKLVSKLLIVTILTHAASFFMFKKEQTIQTIKEFIFEKSSAYNLAIFRIIFFILLINTFKNEVFGSFMQWSHLPDSAKVGLPFIGWLIDWLPITPEIYNTMGIIGLVLAFSGLLGFGTKWTLKLYIPIALYLWGIPCFYGKLNHHHIIVWIPIIFAFSRCSDVLSVDALLRKIRGKFKKPEWSVAYGLPFKVMWLLLGIIYCCSGFHKLWDTGLFWALSENLTRQIQLEWIENYDVISAFRIDQYPTLLKIGGIGVILFEITYPLLLLKPATRILNFLGSWSLHLTAGYFMNIDFAYLRRIHFSLFNWEKWWNWIRRKNISIPKTTEDHISDPKEWNSLKKYTITYVGMILIGANLSLGILGISSWPFSAYPAYSGIVNENVQIIQMNAIDTNGNEVNVKEIGKGANFRWENIRPFEERIAEAIEKNDTIHLQDKLQAYWKLWNTKVDGLNEVRSVEMYLQKTSLIPEERNIILDSIYLGTINIGDHER